VGKMKDLRMLTFLAVAMILISFLPGCTENTSNNTSTKKTITVWHTFPENSKKKRFLKRA
jgi:maltose-binding protein MalE